MNYLTFQNLYIHIYLIKTKIKPNLKNQKFYPNFKFPNHIKFQYLSSLLYFNHKSSYNHNFYLTIK